MGAEAEANASNNHAGIPRPAGVYSDVMVNCEFISASLFGETRPTLLELTLSETSKFIKRDHAFK